jgi:hypothetical protein
MRQSDIAPVYYIVSTHPLVPAYVHWRARMTSTCTSLTGKKADCSSTIPPTKSRPLLPPRLIWNAIAHLLQQSHSSFGRTIFFLHGKILNTLLAFHLGLAHFYP